MEQFRSKHKQTQSEWEAEMSKKVLEFVRSELYMDLRFLDIALGTLVYRADENIRSFADLPDGHSVGWKDAFENGFEIFYKGLLHEGEAVYESPDFTAGLYITKIVEACLKSNQTGTWQNV